MPAPDARAAESEDLRSELLEVFHDRESGLRGAVAVHSTTRGPAMGGLRVAAYRTLDELVADALRLASTMSYKNAAAGLPLGGGKAVLLEDGGWTTNRRARLTAFARQLARLGGRYITAEDMGTTPEDMATIAATCRHVAGLPPEAGGSGDPSPSTARTVFASIHAAARIRLGRDGLTGVRVGVLGVGAVGPRLTRLLLEAAADVTVADPRRQPCGGDGCAHLRAGRAAGGGGRRGAG